VRIRALFLRIFFKKYDIIGTRNANLVVCNSNNIKNKVKQIYRKIGVVHYIGTEIQKSYKDSKKLDLKRKLKLDVNVKILFTLGLSHHSKGVIELIYIFRKILTLMPDTILLIGGEIEKRNYKKIRNLIKKLKIPINKVIFFGFILLIVSF